MKPYLIRTSDRLRVEFYKDRAQMGAAAAKEGADYIRELLKSQPFVNVIFAAAPSQNETLAGLVAAEGIDWTRVRAFHMDEYVGLSPEAPQCFGNFLRRAIFDKLPFKEVHYLSDYKGEENICREYSELLKKYPVDIVFLGIGENAHIAFNDPHEARFDDVELVKTVTLDLTCRNQQVNDGCFATLDDVPEKAVTLTIPALVAAKKLVCTVPAATKADAVARTLYAKICEAVPATAMRLHPDATMFVERESGKKALFATSVITDEISQDFETACALAAKYAFSAVEIRSVWETPCEKLTDGQIAEILKTTKKYGLNISAVGTALLKCNQGEEREEQFKSALSVAKKLGTKIVRAFTYFKSDGFDEGALVQKLGEYGRRLQKEDMLLAVENEPSVNACSGERLREIIDKVNLPNVLALWDAGNNLYGGSELPSRGYEFLKGKIAHVHVKDAIIKDGRTVGVALGEGECGWESALKALLDDGYNGYITLEPHYKKGKEIDESLLIRPYGSAFSDGAAEGTEECMQNIFCLFEKIV